MLETGLTLASVAFGALLSYIAQRFSQSRLEKEQMRSDKIKIYQRLLKVDKLRGPANNMHAYHFDPELFMEKIYSVLLDDYYYYPKEVCTKFDHIYFVLKDAEFNDIPPDVSSAEFYTHLNETYLQGIFILEKELKELIK